MLGEFERKRAIERRIMSPLLTKLAEDRAEQLRRDPDKVAQELDGRLRGDLQNTGDFSRIHPLPRNGADVPDDRDARPVEGSFGRQPARKR